ncbi:MAG: hypothetical protein Q9208_004823 [Pyrenodesmia sp. 3 TL-2023]
MTLFTTGLHVKLAAKEGRNGTSEASLGLAHKTIEHLKETSMSQSDRLWAPNYWLRDPRLVDKCELTVFENKSKRYTLVPSQKLLEHEKNGDPGYDLFTITWNPASDREGATSIFTCDGDRLEVTDFDTSQTSVLSMRTSHVPSIILPCIFVALGWLRGKDLGAAERMQTTYYTVLLNLSTCPVSVWLMFDYHIETEENGDRLRWTNQLGDYDNQVWPCVCQKEVLPPKLKDRFPPMPSGYITRFRDFLRQDSNLLGPLSLCRDQPTPQGNGCHKRDSSGSFSQGSTLVDNTDNNVPANELDIDTRGYFGLPRHDLVLLAPDINSWSPTEGFDTQQVPTFTSDLRFEPRRLPANR